MGGGALSGASQCRNGSAHVSLTNGPGEKNYTVGVLIKNPPPTASPSAACFPHPSLRVIHQRNYASPPILARGWHLEMKCLAFYRRGVGGAVKTRRVVGSRPSRCGMGGRPQSRPRGGMSGTKHDCRDVRPVETRPLKDPPDVVRLRFLREAPRPTAMFYSAANREAPGESVNYSTSWRTNRTNAEHSHAH